MLVKRLKPWVTSFSEAIKHQYKHGDEVWVGGQITDIFSVPDVADLFPDAVGDTMLDSVYITLDDGVGVNHLAIPRTAFNEYNGLFDIKVGQVILAQGRVFHLEMKETVKGKTRDIKNHPEGAIRIYCWKIVPLPENQI